MTTNIQSFAGDVQIDNGNLSVKSLEVKDGVTKLGSNNTTYSNVGVMMTRKGGASNVAFLFTEDGANVVLGYTNDDALEGDRIDILSDEKANLVVYGNVYVTGSVHGDGSTLTGLVTTLQSVTEYGQSTDRTILFTNPITGINVSSNVLVSGNVTAGVYFGDGGLLSNITQTLEGITAIGNTTPYTLEFNNTATSFVTASNVGISNALPTADLCVGANVVIDDVRLNKIDVAGNVACHQLNLGTIEVLPAYSLENVTQISNTTTRTVSFNNSTLAFDTQKMAGIGILPSSADVGASGLHVDGHLRLGGAAGNNEDELMYIKAAGALGVLANHSATDNTNTELRLQSGDANNSNITMVGKSSAQYMTFGTNAAERMRITSAGNVGIGMASPTNILHLYKTTTPVLYMETPTTGVSAYTTYTNSTDGNTGYCGIDGTGLFAHSSGALALGTNDTPIVFSPNYSTGEKMRITTTGHVGIGTKAPGTILEVNGTVESPIVKRNASADTDTFNYILNGPRPGTTSSGAVHFINGSTRSADGGSNVYTIRNDSGNLRLGRAGSDTLLEGNVGIGTNNPQDVLHVYENSTSAEQLRLQNDNELGRAGVTIINAAGQFFKIQHIGGATASSNAAIIENFSGVNGGIQFYAKGDGDYQFRTTDSNTERMRITNAGNVGIGTNNPTHPLHILNGDASYIRTGPNTTYNSTLYLGATLGGAWASNECGVITTNGNLHIDAGSTRDIYLNYYSGNNVNFGSVGGVVHSSDDRLKTQEELIENATQTLMKLKPQKYLKAIRLPEDNDVREPRTEAGLIAQDVWYDAPELRFIVKPGDNANPSEEKPPEPVTGDIQQDPDYSDWGTTPAGLSYTCLIPYLIKSNQELYTEIQALESQLASVLARLDALENT
jgi:hypothetical protein